MRWRCSQVVGYDPLDSATVASRDRATPDYSKSLQRDGLKGARIGVLTQAYLTPTTDTEVVRVFNRALSDLRKQGATVLDSVMIPELDSLRRAQVGGCNPFKLRLRTVPGIAKRHDTAGEDGR